MLQRSEMKRTKREVKGEEERERRAHKSFSSEKRRLGSEMYSKGILLGLHGSRGESHLQQNCRNCEMTDLQLSIAIAELRRSLTRRCGPLIGCMKV